MSDKRIKTKLVQEYEGGDDASPLPDYSMIASRC